MRLLHVLRRVVLLVAVVVCAARPILLSAAEDASPADTVGAIGDEDRLVVRGMVQIDPERLRRALREDLDLVWLSRPSDSREPFVAAVVEKARLALQRAGFESAQVQARIESSDGVERLVLEITEGRRVTAGRIEVSGVSDDVAERLVQFLSKPQPPLDAVPRPVDLPGGASSVTWVDSGGRPATLQDAEWVRGEPAACDAIAARSVRAAVARFLRDEGYLAIAPLVERTSDGAVRGGTTYTVRSKWIDMSGTHEAFTVSLRRADDVADLVVAIEDLPPKSMLRDIELPGGCRTTKRELTAFLGLEMGQAVTERHRLQWQHALRRSARFLRQEIEFRTDPDDPAAVVARFDFEEYPRATPLSQPLSRAEATMVRFHDWLVDATGRGELVIDVRRTPAEAAAAIASARCVVSSTNGFVLTAMPGTDATCGLIASGSRFGLISPGGRGCLDLPVPSRTRLTTTISLTLTSGTNAGATVPKYERNLTVGCGFASGTAAAGSGMGVEVRCDPVACLAMVYEDDPAVSFEGETLVLATDGATVRFDTASGRLVSLACQDYEVEIGSGTAAVDAAADALRTVAGENHHRDGAPVTSAVEWLTTDGVTEACAELIAACGLSTEDPAIARLASVAATARGCLARCLADGGIARCDEVIAAWRAVDDPAVEPLEIPQAETNGSPRAVQKAIVRKAAAWAWRITEEHCGRDSWPASLARAAACGLVGDPAIFREITAFLSNDDYGPLAYACAATFAPQATVAKSLAFRGQERLSTIAFHTDCRPLLKAVETYGIDDICVSVLRSIDDGAVRDIGRAVCGDAELLMPLVTAVRSHDGHDRAVDALQEALDVWWEERLRSLIAARLDAVASPRTAAASAGTDDKPLKK